MAADVAKQPAAPLSASCADGLRAQATGAFRFCKLLYTMDGIGRSMAGSLEERILQQIADQEQQPGQQPQYSGHQQAFLPGDLITTITLKT